MNDREIMMKRIDDMGLNLEEIYRREKTYFEALRDNPVRDEINIYTVFKFYINL